MMKKIILILALMTWYNVQAKTLYTDYEFQGYTEEKLEDDELTKYEEVTINRFYELVEREITYNPMTEPGIYDYVDLNDFIISGGYTKKPVENILNLNVLSTKYSNNYKFRTIRISGITNYEENIKKLEFYENFDFLKTTITQDEETQDLIITFEKEVQIEDVNIYVEYQTEEDVSISITPENITDESSDTMEVMLNKKETTLVMNFVDSSTYEGLIEYLELDSTTINIPRYYYVIIDYKHYNLEKVYYKDSELETIDGYMYDPEESYIKYKKYTREIISKDDPEDKPEDKPEEKPKDNPDDKPIEKPENPKEDEDSKDETENKPEQDKDNTEVKPTNPNPPTEEDKPNENNPSESTDKTDDDSNDDNKDENQSTNLPDASITKEDYENIKSELTSIIEKLEKLEQNIQKNNTTTTTVKKPTTNTKLVSKKTSTTTKLDEQQETTSEEKLYNETNEPNDKTTNIVTNQTTDKERANDMTKPLECEENKRSKVLTAIGIVLILISIILDVVHFISVKFGQ